MENELRLTDEEGRALVIRLPPKTDIAKIVRSVQSQSNPLVRKIINQGVPGEVHERITIYEEW